ncbi:hypothetical protein KC19_4G081600 [Ceratodon purpureus]|uniref:DUF642 domain-containing protein n=1 Tax=Ceratodon purpureus TaxID=3225 RepID=A0A8T0I836_CERPU|nr:hypothetical protein KC19_4G081600 [Ceratodon purpureus]
MDYNFLPAMETTAEAMTYVLWFCASLWITHADPYNLVQNGDFNVEGFVFNQYPVMDVIATGINTLVPFWVATDGGVQMLDSTVYQVPSDVNSSTIMHLNYKDGPGRMVSMPMYTLREGALYTVSCRLADNPDGGPVFKTMRLGITDIFGKRVGPKLEPFVVSNHSTTRTNILWETVALNVRGTGKPAFLTVDSNTPGSYGPLVANVQVTLSNIVENGSFETLDSSVNTQNVTFFVILKAPSTALVKWLLEAGSLKIASAARYQASTDNTAVMLDLNADDSAAMISTTFAIKPKTPHVLLFDSAINPEEQNPIQGQILVLVQGQPSATLLLNKAVDMDSTGFSIDSVGWNTYEFSFETGKQDIKVKITFQSKISGNFGPLLDNVCVYEVIKSLSDANETISDVPATVASSSFNFYTNLQGDAPPTSLCSIYQFLPTALMMLLSLILTESH